MINIIKKNIKLLLRSKVSSLVLILGPLLIIMLVGISFSTNTFNLNIGIFSSQFTDISNSLSNKLSSDGYSITKYETENLCIESVKMGQSHACVIFPPDMKIENLKENLVKIYVDQSKINLAYLVKSSLSESFHATSSEISLSLTEKIVQTLLNAKSTLEKSMPYATSIKEANINIYESATASKTKLGDLDFNVQTFNPDAQTTNIKAQLDKLLSDSSEIISDCLDLINSLNNWVEPNGTQYLNEMKTKLHTLNSTIGSGHVASIREATSLAQKVNQVFAELSSKMDKAKITNKEVIQKIENIEKKSTELKDAIVNLENQMQGIINSISGVQVTEAENIVSPFKIEVNGLVRGQNNLTFMFPSIIVIFIMFIGLLLPATLIIMEKNSKAFFRVFTTPTRNRLFMSATFITCLIIILFQLFLILLVSTFYFKINFTFLMFFTILVITTFFILVGMLIGYLFRTEEIAMLFAVSLSTILLLTSGLFFPLEGMPKYLIDKAKFNPIVLSSEMFKRSLLFGADLKSIIFELKYLFAFSFVVGILIILVKKGQNILFFLKKPSRTRMKKEYVENLFKFGDRNAKTLAEFIVCLQNMSDEKVLSMHDYIQDWLVLIYKSKNLAEKVKKFKSKQEIIQVLIDELRSLSEKK